MKRSRKYDSWFLFIVKLMISCVVIFSSPASLKAEQDEKELHKNPIIVAVIDTGVDYTHPVLAGHIWINEDEIPDNGIDDDNNGYVDDIHGWDFVDIPSNIVKIRTVYDWQRPPDDDHVQDPEPMDSLGHGTQVTGTILQATDTPIKIMPLRVSTGDALLPSRPSTQQTIQAIANAIRYAVDNGAKVINISLGVHLLSSQIDLSELEVAIEEAHTKNVIIVASAGNEKGTFLENKPTYPAVMPHVISVGAVDKMGKPANFSNKGDVYALGSRGNAPIPGGHCTIFGGTSMAAPIVASLVAHLLSENPNLTSDEIEQMINSFVVVKDEANILKYPALNPSVSFGKKKPDHVQVGNDASSKLAFDRSLVKQKRQNTPSYPQIHSCNSEGVKWPEP